MRVLRIKKARAPEVSDKAAKRPSIKRIAQIVRKAAPPEWTPKKGGKIGPKYGEKPADQGL